MGDGSFELRSGRIIAVDTATLRYAATCLDELALDASQLRATVAEGLATLRGASSWAVERLLVRIGGIGASAGELADGLRRMALAYEFVEIEARRAAASAAGDAAAVAHHTVEAGRLAASSPEQARLAERLAGSAADPHADVLTQLFWGSLPFGGVGALAFGVGGAALAAVKAAGLGAVPARSRHLRVAPSPTVTLVRSAAGTAPTTLRGVAARIPTGREGGIRVERYTMAGGERRYALYLTGTRAFGGSEVFDMASNTQLYLRRDADSLAAARIALERAGAEPGDRLIVSGHSQGAMAGTRLALEGEYDVTALMAFGNPVQADLGPGTLHIDVRHTDDPVAALAAGGHDAAIGAPGSFVAERSADPVPSVDDLRLTVHQLDAYVDSAGLLDASGDPRMEGLRQRLAELDSAASVEVFAYDAESAVTASSADGG